MGLGSTLIQCNFILTNCIYKELISRWGPIWSFWLDMRVGVGGGLFRPVHLDIPRSSTPSFTSPPPSTHTPHIHNMHIFQISPEWCYGDSFLQVWGRVVFTYLEIKSGEVSQKGGSKEHLHFFLLFSFLTHSDLPQGKSFRNPTGISHLEMTMWVLFHISTSLSSSVFQMFQSIHSFIWQIYKMHRVCVRHWRVTVLIVKVNN